MVRNRLKSGLVRDISILCEKSENLWLTFPGPTYSYLSVVTNKGATEWVTSSIGRAADS